MRDGVAELAAGWHKHGHELGFGMGIAHGYATLGRIGFEGRFDYSAIGTVVNLAARLCAQAAAGQILIDPKVHAAVETLAETEPAGELTLKGLSRADQGIQHFRLAVGVMRVATDQQPLAQRAAGWRRTDKKTGRDGYAAAALPLPLGCTSAV